MTAKKPSVGAALEAWCTKCKDDKPHVTETLKKDGNVWKVRCDVCDGSHLYRVPQGADGAKTGTKKKAAGTKKKTKAPDVSEAEAASAKEYVVGGDFSVGDVMKHARFGLGKVTEVRPAGKMLVAFDGGPRLLLCRDVPTVGKRRVAAPRAPVVVKPAAIADADDGDDGDESTSATDDAEE